MKKQLPLKRRVGALVLLFSFFLPKLHAQTINTVAGVGTSSFSGDGGSALLAELAQPVSVARDASGNIYIADQGNHRIRKYTLSTGVISTVAGSSTAGYSGDGGAATSAKLYYPASIAVDASGNIYIADQSNQRVRKVTASTGVITTVAGTGTAGFSGDGGAATSAQLNQPSGVAVDASGNVYISDQYNQRIRKITVSTGNISTIAGTGTYGYSGDGGAATSATFQNPAGLRVDASGNIFIADLFNHVVRKITASTGNISTIAGTGTAGFSGDGGAATSANLNFPTDVSLDDSGNVYIAVQYSHRIRKVRAATGFITTFAGTGTAGYSGDGGPATSANINYPTGITTDAGGNLYIADRENHRIRFVCNYDVKPTVVSPLSYCVGDAASPLTATGTSLRWFTSAVGGAGSATAPTPLTTTAGTTKYYVASVSAYGCEGPRDSISVTVNALPAAPTATSPVTYCVGATASALSATGTSLKWYTSATGGTASSTAPTPSTASAGSTTYYVSQTSASGCESPRTPITVTVNPFPAAPVVSSPVSLCEGITATALSATGTSLLWYTSATGGTGSSTAPTPSTASAGTTTYYVSQSNSCGEGPRASITVNVNAKPAAPTVTASVSYCQYATASALSATGTSLKWYTSATGGTGSTIAPTPSTTATGTTTYYVSQTSAAGCESDRASITVTIVAAPALASVASPVNYCVGATATALSATGTGLLWYTSATGGTGSATAPTPSTASAGTTTYYVSQTNSSGCEGLRASVTVNVNAIPAAPAVISPVNLCVGASASSLSASGTGLLWYTSASGGTGSATAPTPSTASAGTTTYYVSQTSAAGCESARASISVTVNALPAAPTVAAATISYCQGATASALSATGTSLKWYTSATGGTGSSTAPTPSTASAGTTTYYVSQTSAAGCESTRTSISVTVNASPAAPSVTTPVTYCVGATATALTASGTSLLWYTSASGGTGSATAPTPSTASAGTTTYYVSQTSAAGCEGPRAAIAVNVNPTPLAPTVISPLNLCVGTTASALTATGTSLLWYTAASGGTGSSSAPTPSTASTGTTTYYVSQTTSCGESPRASITVNVNPVPAAPTVVSPLTFCQGDTGMVALSATGTGLKWYTSATGGTGSSTAPVPSTATAGTFTWYVSQTNSFGCEGPRASISVKINVAPAAPIVTSPIHYCVGATATPLTATGTGLTWYTIPYGGTGTSTAPTPSTATAGTFTWYVSQTDTSDCPSLRAAVTVIVHAVPAAPTVSSPVNYCQFSAASALTASVSTGDTVKWHTAASGGTPSLSAPTPSTTATGTTTYYVSATSAYGCGEGLRSSITVNVNPTPAAPTFTSPVNYCVGATATALSASGTSIKWYTTATGGTASSTAPTPSTASAGTFKYYVSQTNASGCESVRDSITVVVNALPTAPAVSSPITYCVGATATALTATGSGLLWYTSASGGTGSASAPTPSTATAGSTTYYVSQTTAAGCEGPRASIVVNVNTGTAAPAVLSPINYCVGATASAVTASGTSLLWYTSAAGGTGSTTAPTPSTATAHSDTFYVTQTLGTGGCGESPRAAIIVNVNAGPAAPTVVSPVNYCVGDVPAALTATGTSLKWYTSATGGSASSSAFTPSTSAAGSTTYYVSQTNAAGCEGTRAAIVVNVNALPAAPSVTATVSYCVGATASALTATGTSLKWYTSATGGTASTSAPTSSTATAGSTTYYVSQTNASGCEGSRASITVTVNSIPAAPTVTTPIDYCKDATAAALTATGTSLKWYTAATGGTALSGAPTPSTTTTGTTTYYVSQTSAAGCESARTALAVNVNAVTAAPTVAASSVSYCQGATAATLSATGTSLKWYTSATGGTASSTAPTPSTATAGTTNYYVSQTNSFGCESARTAIAVVVNATPAAPTVVSPKTYCSNDTATALSATGTSLQWYTAATGGTGSTTAPTPSTAATGATSYYVSQTSAAGCESPRAEIEVVVYATPSAPTVGFLVTLCLGGSTGPLVATGSGLKWYTTATGGTGSTTPPTPSTATTGATYYYVSQTSSGGCEGPRAAILVNVDSLLPAPTVVSPISYCEGASAAPLSATGSSLRWYAGSRSGAYTTTAPTPSTSVPGRYVWYVNSVSSAGCEGKADSIVVTINAKPAAPTVVSPVTYCAGATATALSASGTSLKWYTAASGGTGASTAPTPSTATAGTTIYYVSQTSAAGCESNRAAIAVNVNPIPAAPLVTDSVSYCQNALAAALSASGTSLKWYTSATGGTGTTSAPTPSTATAGSTFYYVSQTSADGCEGPRASIKVIVNPLPATPTVTSPVAYCIGETTTALSAAGVGLKWYTTASGGTGSTTAPTPSSAIAGTFTYYVSQTNSFGCEGPRDSITVIINSTLPAPTVTSPVAYCVGASASALTAVGSGLKWYTAATGGTGSSTAPTPSTATSGTTTYYVSQTSAAGCEGTRASIVVNVNPLPAAPTVSSPVNYCKDATASALSATGTSLKWYTVATGGTGSSTAPTPSTATAGTTIHYVSSTSTDGCEGPRASISVQVNPLPATPSVTTPVSYCQDAVAVPLSATGTSLKWYTSATGGTAATTAPTPTTTTAGTFKFYVSQTNSFGCEGPRDSITVTINPLPAAPSVTSPIAYCVGASASPLTATGTSLKWYTAATGGTGSSTAPTPSTATSGTTTYYVSQTSAAGCEGTRASIVVNVNPLPAAPTVSSPVNYCKDATASALSATGTSLKWYTVATGGTGSSTAPTPSTATAGTTIYYVSSTSTDGCEGPRASISVQVNPLPATPSVTTPVSYCQDAVAVPLSATGTSLKWYTSATGGTAATTAPTPTTTTAGTFKFYVSQTNSFGCEGPRDSITVTINPLPAAPTVTSPVAYCVGASASPLTATGTSLKWYTAATGGTGSSTAPTPSTATSGTTTYYVSQTSAAGCEGTRASIVVNVNPLPAAPTVTSPVNYCKDATASALSATGTSLKWYTVATGGTGSSTAPTPSTATAGTTIYYVSATSTDGCEGPRASISVQVNPLPAKPTVTTPVSYCQGAIAAPLSATGTSLKWYTSATGGTAVTTAPTPVTTTAGTFKFYVSQTNSFGCEGPRDSITVTVNPLPTAPSAKTTVGYCLGASASPLTATGTSLKWYTVATGGTGSSTAPTPSTASVGITFYYVSQTSSEGCEGPRTTIKVEITDKPDLAVTPLGTTHYVYCKNDTVVLEATSKATIASYQWYKNGVLLPGETAARYKAFANGFYKAVVKNEYGCEKDTTVYVFADTLPDPILTPTDLQFCPNVNIVIFASPSSPLYRYEWYKDGLLIPGEKDSRLVINKAGNYHIIVTDSFGCKTETNHSIASTYPPVPKPFIIRTGMNLRLSRSYVAYQWIRNSKPVPGAAGPTFTMGATGKYWCEVTDLNGCKEVSDTVDAEFTNAVKENVAGTQLKIYPNPTSGKVTIEAQVPVTIRLSELTGKILEVHTNAHEVDLSPYADGVYFLSIFDDNDILIKVEKIDKLSTRQ